MVSPFRSWVRRLESLFSRGGVLPSASGEINVAESVRQLFASHGIPGTLSDGVIRFASSPHWVWAALVREWRPTSSTVTVQLDARLVLNSGEHVVESFVGVGATIQDAAKDALANFAACSLHVLLTAFFGSPARDQVEVETWEIAGVRYDAVIGGMGVRGAYPLQGPAAVAWFKHAASEVSRQELPRRLYWIRFFYSQHPAESPTTEALLNNEVCQPLQQSLADFDWPKSSAYYSVRVFLVLKPTVTFTGE